MRRTACVATLAYALCAPLRAPAQDEAEQYEEHEVKAAYLFGFAGYVQWPVEAATDRSPFRIGVAGAADIARQLAIEVADDTIGGRAIDVVELDGVDAVDDLDILFVGRSEAQRLANYLEAVDGQPVLTVTEFDGALDGGSMINFLLVAENVRFEVSLPAVQRSPLRLNARMLRVAERVVRRSGRQ